MSYPITRVALEETFSFNPQALNEGTSVEKLPGGRYRFRAKAQHCGVKNRNNRVYPIPVWERHLTEGAPFMQRVRSRRVIGHLEHPTDGKSQLGLAAVLVVEVDTPNKKGEVWAIFETLSTPAGRIIEAFIRDCVGFGISSRGNGSVVNKGGIDEVQEDYEPVTFDMVIDESTPGAEVHARKLRESLNSLMESVGGNQVLAIRRDQELAERAVERAMLAEVSPPTGFSAFLMAYEDGSAHYRGYDDGAGKWDVWLHPSSLPPEPVVNGLTTQESAKEAARQHYKMVQLSGARTASAEASQAVQREWGQGTGGHTPSGGGADRIRVNVEVPTGGNVRETFSVASAMPYSGIALKLTFASSKEAKDALAAVDRAGFHANLEGETTICVYTSIEDEEAATAHLSRVLSLKGINMQAESAGYISRGRPIWENDMRRHLNEMPYGGMGQDEMPYDEMPYETYDMEEEDDEEDDEDDDADEAYGYEGDDPEDLDLDVDVDESEGHVRVWYDEDDDPVEYHYYDGDGVLEAVVDMDGDILMEGPSGAQRAMFAKAFASDNKKATKKSGTATAARLKNPAYYKKFRKTWVSGGKSSRGKKVKAHGKGMNVQAAGKDGVRVKGGKGTKARVTRAKARRKSRTGMDTVSAKEFKKGGRSSSRDKRTRARAYAKRESIEQFYDQDTGLVETWFDGECVATHDPDTGIILFEHPDYDAGELLTEKSFSRGAYQAMFSKAFSRNPRSLKTGKPASDKSTATHARKSAKKGSKVGVGYRKFRTNWAKKHGVMQKYARGPKKGGVKWSSGKKGGKAALRIKAGGPRHKQLTGKGKKKRKSRKESYENHYDNDLFEDTLDILVCEDTGLVFDYDDNVIGAIDENDDIIDVDDLDDEWLDEAMDITEGGTTPEKAGVRMKGAGFARSRGKTNAPRARHGGKHDVKTKGGSPSDESYDDDYDESYDDFDSYDPYVERLESQVARQQEVIDAFQDLQQVEALESHKAQILGSYPELGVVESRLDACQTVAEMREEAEALLSLVETGRSTHAYTGSVNGNSMNSDNVGGAPSADLLTESESSGIDLGSAPTDTASRVAASRRRRLAQNQN